MAEVGYLHLHFYRIQINKINGKRQGKKLDVVISTSYFIRLDALLLHTTGKRKKSLQNYFTMDLSFLVPDWELSYITCFTASSIPLLKRLLCLNVFQLLSHSLVWL